MLQEVDDLDQNHTYFIQHPSTSLIFGLNVLTLGVSSLFYHACVCSLGSRLLVGSWIGTVTMPIFFQLTVLVPSIFGIASHFIFLPFIFVFTGIAFALPEILNLVTVEWRFLDIGFFAFIGLDFLLLILVVIRLSQTYVLHKKFLVFSFISVLVAVGLWAPEGFFHKCLVPTSFPVQPLPGLVHVFVALALLFFYWFFRSISFLYPSDAILWRQAVLLKARDEEAERKDNNFVDFEGAMRFDL
eukprot:TRINITY_DN755_c0_g1_i1.p1 TRINITY_DN755_c0_g1~~TRINITY_DN755_c0_g1_i1.p1  ORF type:complete len:243 (-),score=43.92 TRINITY_DN755_c0_g1_i1:135-863(-)